MPCECAAKAGWGSWGEIRRLEIEGAGVTDRLGFVQLQEAVPFVSFVFFKFLFTSYIYFFTVKKEQPAMQTDVLLDHHLAAPLLRL